MSDAYETLGVSRTAPESVIKAAYRARIRETHPDAGGDPAEAQAVNDAYDILCNPERRAAHDRQTAPLQPSFDAEPTTPAAAAASDEVPEPVYSRHGPPTTWWRQKLTWIPAVILLALGFDVGGWVGAVAVVAGMLVVSHWSRRNALIAVGLSTAPGLWMLDATDVHDGVHLITAVIPMLGMGALLIVWAITRRRSARAYLAHHGDIFLTTQDRFGLVPYEVMWIASANGGGMSLVHLDRLDGVEEWPQPTTRDDGRVSVGEFVLVHHGRIVVSATSEMLRAAR